MLKKEDGLLDLTMPAEQLARRVRAYNPRPGTFLPWDGSALKVHRAHAEAGEATIGRKLVLRGQPAIATSEGLLVLDNVQPSGKKAMEGRAFLAGARNWAD
jgi:methionyl-tRNA formyltransferase